MSTQFKIAVATSDGKTSDLHFGHAKEFLILGVNEDGTYTEEERRDVFSACNGECEGMKAPEAEHGSDETSGDGYMDKACEQLSDCEFVLAAKIGPHAMRALTKKGITPLDEKIDIAEAVKKISEYRARTKKT